MDSVFTTLRKASRELERSGRTERFADQIFKGTSWYLSLQSLKMNNFENNNVLPVDIPNKETELKQEDSLPLEDTNEKEVTLKGLLEFAKEESQAGKKIIPVGDSAHISYRPPKNIVKLNNLNDLETTESGLKMMTLDPLGKWIQLEKKGPKTKIVFSGMELKEEDPNDDQAWILLSKMIHAMKMAPGDIVLLANDITCKRPVMNSFYAMLELLKSKLLISLGAENSSLVLDEKIRLGPSHGTFYERTVQIGDNEFDLKIMPIFHPEYLHINPSMKKTAWEDLQKAMDYVAQV